MPRYFTMFPCESGERDVSWKSFMRLDGCGKKPHRQYPPNKEIKCERRKEEEGDEGTTRWFKAPVFPSGSQSVSNSLSFLSARDHISVYSPLRPISNLLSDEYWIYCVSVGEKGFNSVDSTHLREAHRNTYLYVYRELVSRIITTVSIYEYLRYRFQMRTILHIIVIFAIN